jgi:uncharacterized protein (TIGR02001 family)
MAGCHARRWTDDVLHAYLSHPPKQANPGTKMKYSGLNDAKQLDDPISHLDTPHRWHAPFPGKSLISHEAFSQGGLVTSGDGTGPTHGGETLKSDPLVSGRGIHPVVGHRLPRRGLRLFIHAMAMALAACFAVSAQAQSTDLSGEVALTSQLVDRGLALTPATPAVQAALAWTLPKGWSLAVSGGSEIRSLGDISESLAQLSRSMPLSGDWQMQAGLLYYHYAGNAQARIYDRAEASLDWTYRDILTFGLSADYAVDARESRVRPAADINFHWPLPWHFSFSASAGVAHYVIAPYSHAYGYDYTGSYGYGHAGLLWSTGAWRVELDRVFVDESIRRRWGDLAASPWLGTISWSF